MWRIALVLGLLITFGTEPAEAQRWSGSATLGVSGGYQTNTYLDPVLGTWNTGTEPAFVAVTPQLGITRNASRTRLDVQVRSRLYPRRSNSPQFTQGSLQLQYRLTPTWTLTAIGGGTRYRFAATRDTWWLLPSLQWSPTSETMFTLRTGFTRRHERSFEPTDRQTSGLATVEASHWLTDRFQGGLQLYYSDGRTATAETGFGGSGGSLWTTYWPTDRLSLKVEAAFEQLRYETSQLSSSPSGPLGAGSRQTTTTTMTTVREQIGRVGLEARWQVHPSVTAFGRGRALRAQLAQQSAPDTDVHVSGGIRLQIQKILGGTTEPPPQRRVCSSTEEGVQFRVSYDGPGTPHLTGDFNNWSVPGIPMESTGANSWTKELPLSDGQYQYRIRIARGDKGHWLDLPSYAQTTEDSFGGTNGVCTVY